MSGIKRIAHQGKWEYVWHGHMFATKPEAEAYRDKMIKAHERDAALREYAASIGVDLDKD